MAVEITVDAATKFKSAFRMHPSGVAIVSAAGPQGPVGLTLSSVASVAADPPMLSFSITAASTSAATMLAAPSIMVNLLRRENLDVARAFATVGAPRFTPDEGWVVRRTGEPYLSTAAVALRCAVDQVISAGTSQLVVATVLDVDLLKPGEPLLYYDRTFYTLDSQAKLAEHHVPASTVDSAVADSITKDPGKPAR